MFRNVRAGFLVVVSLLFVIGSLSFVAAEDKTISGAPTVEKPLVAELEDFKMEHGKIVEDKAASGGKAVLAEDLQFVATQTVTITQKGSYKLTIWENAPTGDNDAINIQVNDGGALRTYPSEFGKYVPCQKIVPFTMDAPGTITIKVFTSNEKGALYDRVVIEPFN